MFKAKDLKEAINKVDSINRKIEMMDRFDSSFSRTVKQILS